MDRRRRRKATGHSCVLVAVRLTVDPIVSTLRTAERWAFVGVTIAVGRRRVVPVRACRRMPSRRLALVGRLRRLGGGTANQTGLRRPAGRRIDNLVYPSLHIIALACRLAGWLPICRVWRLSLWWRSLGEVCIFLPGILMYPLRRRFQLIFSARSL